MQIFSEVVKKELKNNKISVSQLAKNINISIPYMYDLLNGRRRWNESIILKVCKVLNLSIEFKAS